MNVATTLVQHSNPFLNAQRQLLTAVEQLGLDRAVYEVLKEPERVIIVSIPVRMDDGSLRTFTGYRAQHTLVTGPAKGGIRFHPDVTLDEIKALSIDRKSTRLNSSHVKISYAVFCLKKKKNK